MGTYSAAFAMLVLAAVGIGLVYLVARRSAIAPEPLTALPFLSGWGPREHALSRYHARWYPLTLLFLAFDVEMLFMYPWAVVVDQVGVEAVAEMFVFLGVLMCGVVWAWREGALRWV
ncbi:MAG: NADH-quinone oxidoreductase subunit A [Tomitella sp.]|nr:NADH-quinone oxidoreductase subunit A [Tomitella sp.]